jgi:hypothetical protein
LVSDGRSSRTEYNWGIWGENCITNTAALLLNLLGFITGLVVYVMLLWIVFTSRPGSNRLALLTGILGFAANAGAFGGYALLGLGFSRIAPLMVVGCGIENIKLPPRSPNLNALEVMYVWSKWSQQAWGCQRQYKEC